MNELPTILHPATAAKRLKELMLNESFDRFRISYVCNDCHYYFEFPTGAYKRAGASFYVLSEFPDYPEQYFDDNTIFAETLEYAQIDPMKDVDWGERNKTKEYLEKRYCFYDKRTEVLNWDNSKESELDESEIDFFDMTLNPET